MGFNLVNLQMVSKDTNIEKIGMFKVPINKILSTGSVQHFKKKSKYFLDIPTKVFFQHSYEISVFPFPTNFLTMGTFGPNKNRLSVRKDESGIAEVETQEFLSSPYIQMFSFKRYYKMKKNAAVAVTLKTRNFFISHPPR